jgi:uncharacterized protein (DUF2141 family)
MLYVLLILLHTQPDSTRLTINFISDKEGGKVNMAIFSDENPFMDQADQAIVKRVFDMRSNRLTVEIFVPNDVIAISSYHDVNQNGWLDDNWFGVPTEPYGFSNNARGSFGPPKYEECIFDPTKKNEITIYLK